MKDEIAYYNINNMYKNSNGIADKLYPHKSKVCIVHCKCRKSDIIIRAVYIDRFSKEALVDDDGDCYEYDDKSDTWYFKEGWYEIPYFGECIYRFADDAEVIEWVYEVESQHKINHNNL